MTDEKSEVHGEPAPPAETRRVFPDDVVNGLAKQTAFAPVKAYFAKHWYATMCGRALVSVFLGPQNELVICGIEAKIESSSQLCAFVASIRQTIPELHSATLMTNDLSIKGVRVETKNNVREDMISLLLELYNERVVFHEKCLGTKASLFEQLFALESTVTPPQNAYAACKVSYGATQGETDVVLGLARCMGLLRTFLMNSAFADQW